MESIEFGSEQWKRFWRRRKWTKKDRLELDCATQDRKPPKFTMNMLKPAK